jgi:hypothetical protein
MKRLKLYAGTLGAVFLLVVVAAGMLGSSVFEWSKERIRAFLF